MSAILNMSNVAFRWPGRDGFGLAVRQFDLAVGESVLLLGDSGSGKSTLLSLICGTVAPDRGLIEVAGTDITQLGGGARDRFRAAQIGVIFQQFNLLPFGSVADNILLPLKFAPERRARAGDARAEAATLCDSLGLPPEVMSAKASRLSVGQQQRVAMARAMIGRPPLVVADEPTSALDENSQTAFLDLLFREAASHRTSILMVSHDPRLGARFDRVVRIEDIAQIVRKDAA